MHSFRRILFLGAVALVTGCVGGPVSDLPHSGSDNDTPVNNGHLDAGPTGSGSAPLDAAVPATEGSTSDAGILCDDAGADAGTPAP